MSSHLQTSLSYEFLQGHLRTSKIQVWGILGKPTLDRSLKIRHSRKTVKSNKRQFFADANRGTLRRGSVWMRSQS
ncbi:hypothetical protein YC2023_058878 [Brassica napus]